MKIRQLRPEESWKSELVMAVAFEGDYDMEKAKENAEKEKTEEERAEMERNRCFGAFSDDEGELFACVNSRHYPCRFDGKTYALGGIGGVSTLPPYRRSGAIRGCLSAALRDMYESDFTFSFLYPFRMQYYRKFGYEAGAQTAGWTVPFAELTTEDVGGRVEQLFPGSDMTPLLEVYEKFYADYNLSAVRKAYDKALAKDNLWNQKRYVYVWRNAAGEARGFLIGHKNRADGQTLLDCTCTFQNGCGMLFLDAEALKALLFFAKASFRSDYTAIRFSVPGDIDLTGMVGENNLATCVAFPNGMLRVVNVRRVLENCLCRGTGSVRMEIADGVLPENSGVWSLSFAPGKENTVEKVQGDADVSLTVNDFSALICGARGAADLPWMPQAAVHSTAAPLEGVFYRKKCYMMDLF